MTMRASTFGVVEGFYGVYYTFPQRMDLIRFIASCGYNAYLYAPKNDRQHRTRWWEAYPPQVMQQFAALVELTRQSNIEFAYGISPGGTICYASNVDFDRLTGKLQTFFEIGVRSFSLMLDDTKPHFRHTVDQKTYPTLALAQVDLANRLYDWLIAQDSTCQLSFCPVDYSGSTPFSSLLHQIGAALHANIDIFYTGPEICSPTVTVEDVQAFAGVVHRSPLLWDNYPVNDLTMTPELHLGPIQGRASDIRSAVRGIYVNPMIQPEASKIPLATYAEFMVSDVYDPDIAWDSALRSIAGAEHTEALRVFCKHSISSNIQPHNNHDLDRLVQGALEDLQSNIQLDDSEAVHELQERLDILDEACYHIKYRMENLALRQDLLPWIEVLEHWIWMTRRAFTVLQACENGEHNPIALNSLHEYRALIEHHTHRVPAEELSPLIAYAVEQDKKLAASGISSENSRTIRLPRFSFPRLQWKKWSKTA